jgi:hypothetical protein
MNLFDQNLSVVIGLACLRNMCSVCDGGKAMFYNSYQNVHISNTT